MPLRTGWQAVASVSDSALAGSGLVLPAYAPMGLPVALVLSRPGAVSVLYGSDALPADATVLDLLAQPGAQLTVTRGGGNDAQRVIDTVGSAASLIWVGPYRAAIVHSSTLPNGIRDFGSYWSDGTLDFALAVNASAAEAIRTAQSIYCP